MTDRSERIAKCVLRYVTNECYYDLSCEVLVRAARSQTGLGRTVCSVHHLVMLTALVGNERTPETHTSVLQTYSARQGSLCSCLTPFAAYTCPAGKACTAGTTANSVLAQYEACVPGTLISGMHCTNNTRRQRDLGAPARSLVDSRAQHARKRSCR